MEDPQRVERAVRPFVDRPIADVQLAERAVVEALELWGGQAEALTSSVELLRRGMNALFVAGDVVIRVGEATASAQLSHALAAAVSSLGVATTTPIEGWWANIDGLAVTAWHRVYETPTAIDWEAVGAAVRRVHGAWPGEPGHTGQAEFVPPGYPVPSPMHFPWWDFDSLLGDMAQHVDARALAGLQAAVTRHQRWHESMRTGALVCHGDVHPGNVLVGAGRSLLIDWDLLCWAPPAWDHAMLLTLAERWGGDPSVYAAFASGYGRSMADDELAVTLGELRNVAATLMRVRAALMQPAARAEAERRLRYWRGEADAPSWTAQ